LHLHHMLAVPQFKGKHEGKVKHTFHKQELQRRLEESSIPAPCLCKQYKYTGLASKASETFMCDHFA